MNHLIKIFLITIIAIIPLNSIAQDKIDDADKAIEQKAFSYIPKVNGTIRGRVEYEPEINSYRFQVRNARVSLKGWVLPIVDYKAEIDLCDRGDIKMLDIYGRLHIKNIVDLTLGQMRVPFSRDATRSPHILYFANRSFIGKHVGNVRDIGFKVSYLPSKIPLLIECGIFNGSGIKKHMVWHKKPVFSGKINYKLNNVSFEVGAQSIIPDSIRINLLNTSVSWKADRWTVEGEYVNKHYTNNSFSAVNAYNFFVNYKIPLKWWFNSLSLGTRFDGMDDHSAGYRNKEGKLFITDYARKRLTLGATLGYYKKVDAEICLNYEKYFYDNEDVFILESERDKIVLELMIHF